MTIKDVFGKIGDEFKKIPPPPPPKPLPKLQPLPKPKPLKPLPKPNIKGPIDSFMQKIKDFFSSIKQRFMIGAYVIGGIIVIGLIIKLWPILSGLWSIFAYLLSSIGIIR